MQQYTNLTDKDIVTTGRNRDDAVAVFRLPGVLVSGYERQVITNSTPSENDTGESSTSVLSAPKNLVVESMNVRIGDAGQAVVDAVVSFDEVQDAIKYEVRVSKS